MVTKNSYRSVAKSNSFLLKEKNSKFIGITEFVKSENEVKDTLSRWREEHNRASHLCYAYRLGIHGEIYRSNDDGEPTNSAGTPILGQIIAADLTNTLVGVVRYYGGIKLGVGGLISAYKECARTVLLAAEVSDFKLHRHYELALTYIDIPQIMFLLKRNRIPIIRNEMTNKCVLEIKLEIEDSRDIYILLSKYKDLTIIDLGIL